MLNTIITGSGAYIPEKVIHNDYFLDYEFYDESGERITKSNIETIQKFVDITEIECRRYADDSMLNSDLATKAAQEAIANSGIDQEELDYVMVAHNFGDITPSSKRVDIMPSMSAKVKHKLGIKNPLCRTYDMNFGCPGWIEAVIVAHQFIQANLAKKILVVGSDTLSRAVDPHDRTAMIFADGAGAVVLEAKEQNQKAGIINYHTVCNNGPEMDFLTNGPSLKEDYSGSDLNISMRGRKVYEYAISQVPKQLKILLENSHLHVRDISKILLHQANAKMDHAMINRLHKLFQIKEFDDSVAPMTVQHLGNTSVATVPTMFYLIQNKELSSHEFHANDIILLGSVGAGMNINAIIYQFPEN